MQATQQEYSERMSHVPEDRRNEVWNKTEALFIAAATLRAYAATLQLYAENPDMIVDCAPIADADIRRVAFGLRDQATKLTGI